MRSPFLMLPLAVALAAGCAKEPAAPTVDPVAEKPAAAVNTVSRSHDESSYAEPDKVAISDLARDDMPEAVEDAFRYDRLVLATTTYNNGIFPFMHTFIEHLTEREYQNRTIAIIENEQNRHNIR